jgi:hypothetical protein
VEIDLPELLRKGRERYAHGAATQAPSAGVAERAIWRLWAALMTRPVLYASLSRWSRAVSPTRGLGAWVLRWAVPPAREWTRGRALPQVAPQSFYQQWRQRGADAGASGGGGTGRA